jgi:hypothetical protein
MKVHSTVLSALANGIKNEGLLYIPPKCTVGKQQTTMNKESG